MDDTSNKDGRTNSGKGSNGGDGSKSGYMSYLLRLWQSESKPGPADEHGWLASLEATFTHERRNFPDVASLFAYIESRTRGCDEAEGELLDWDSRDR